MLGAGKFSAVFRDNFDLISLTRIEWLAPYPKSHHVFEVLVSSMSAFLASTTSFFSVHFYPQRIIFFLEELVHLICLILIIKSLATSFLLCTVSTCTEKLSHFSCDNLKYRDVPSLSKKTKCTYPEKCFIFQLWIFWQFSRD